MTRGHYAERKGMILSRASLTLCVLIFALTARSIFVHDFIMRAPYNGTFIGLVSISGALHIAVLHPYTDYPQGLPFTFESRRDGEMPSVPWPEFDESSRTDVLGIIFQHGSPTLLEVSRPASLPTPTRGFSLAVPLPFLAIPFALFPLIRFWHLRVRRRREVSQLCSICGYDLRGTPDRCPECGTSVSPSSPPIVST
jgi:hypothetical protein